MSNKSGVAEQVLSLPKGGGALRGIGEKFAPDLHTGTGNFTIPIAIPAGRNGFHPELNLVYSSGQGNGPFGLGWSLSVPGVARKTTRGVPRYDDEKDVFLLSGAEDLVPVGRTGSSTFYRPRTEGLFAEIAHIRDAVNDYWDVRTRDGLISSYGTAGAAPMDLAVVAKPGDRNRIFAWKLVRTLDPFGNRIEYSYERDTVRQEGPHEWDQIYLSEIRYVDFGDPADPRFLVRIRFVYGARPDPFSDHRAGFEIRTVQRCTRIEIQTQPADASIAVTTYHLRYGDEVGRQALNGLSLLAEIRIEGHDGLRSEELPPLGLGYTSFAPERRQFTAVTGPELPPASLANPIFEHADLFGRGLPDIVQMDGITARYWRNLGDGHYDRPRPMANAPAGVSLAEPAVQFLDANGDGRIDLMVASEQLSGYYPLRFSGEWDRQSFARFPSAPSFDLKDAEVRLFDLDGDGVTDALRSSARFECFFNDPELGWQETRRVERQDIDAFPNVNFSDPRVKLADMTGDGLTDIVLVHDGLVEYWPSLGRGDFGPRVQMGQSPRLSWGYDPRRVLLGDVDGDGLADLVLVDDTKVTLWINQGGNEWTKPIIIIGTPAVTDADAVRLVDLLGSGIRGLLWSRDLDALSHDRMFFLDFTGGQKPYLLSEMDDNRGAVTRVGYAPSTGFYLEDQALLANHWKTPLPFPVQVVARVEVLDSLSGGKLTSEYHYHHGYWDGGEREFRGFGRVDQRDTEVFEAFHEPGLHPEGSFNSIHPQHFSPPTETRTWFHLGPVGDEFGDWTEVDFTDEFWAEDAPAFARPQSTTKLLEGLPRRARRDALRTLRGQVLRTEVYALDGTMHQDRPYTVTEHQSAIREEAPPSNSSGPRRRIFFPHSVVQRTTQWERGSEPMTVCELTGDYDPYGQARSHIRVGVPRGRDFRVRAATAEPYLATHTITEYANALPGGPPIVDRVARVTTWDFPGSTATAGLRDFVTAIESALLARRVTAHAVHFYDGAAFEGLMPGTVGRFGALVRTEELVLPDYILPADRPAYLAVDGPKLAGSEYPQEFRSLLTPAAGYVFRPADGPVERGYYAATQRYRYDFQESAAAVGRGLRTALRDPLGHETTVDYDSLALLPVKISDPVGLETAAAYDYRVLQPSRVTDPNGNQTAFAFTPLGLLASKAVMGKEGEAVGDTLGAPSTQFAYDFRAYVDRGQPVSVRTVRRVHHEWDIDVPTPERGDTIETREYSDGFGRLVQTRTEAEDVLFGHEAFGTSGLERDQGAPVGEAVGRRRTAVSAPNVVVSGWQIYDNKGRVVEKYEPFFASGWDYTTPSEEQRGVRAVLEYDPRGQVIRTINPDRSEQRVVPGVPGVIGAPDLTTPAVFEPTPWEAYTYDANDNAGRTHPSESVAYQAHWNTPVSTVVDAFGRTVMTVERNGPDPNMDWYTTRSTFDSRDNVLTVTDAYGRLAFDYAYDLADRALRSNQLDAGLRRAFFDALGNPVEQWDSKGALVLHAYDPLNRSVRMWARDETGGALTLRERLEYGDRSQAAQPPTERDTHRAANRLGKLHQHYDEAGRVTFVAYDFQGNVRERTREVIKDDQILNVFANAPSNWQITAFRVDWECSPGGLEARGQVLLDPRAYQTSFSYDALRRITSIDYPEDIVGKRRGLRPRYNRAGALEHVEFDDAIFVQHVAYNAKGQRLLIAYGNGVMTRYLYDPLTFRLSRLLSEPFSVISGSSFHRVGACLQDFAYQYDFAGNLRALSDRTPGSGVPNTVLGEEALDREFAYDPLYRLRSATGRECDVPAPLAPWDDTPKCQDMSLTRLYRQSFEYDSVSNLLTLSHAAGVQTTVRRFRLAKTSAPSGSPPVNNRLAAVEQGNISYAYAYDPNGNMIGETTSRHFEWDHSDRLRAFRTQTSGAEPTIHAQYMYDASGERVKKLVRKPGQVEVTVYVDGVFEHRTIRGTARVDQTIANVMDGQKRVASVRVGAAFPNDSLPGERFELCDHLGSINMVIDANGQAVNREEFMPYGTTSFGGALRKRYRFNGKEREESGLTYYGARYYAIWLARWMSCDPAGLGEGVGGYGFALMNPINNVDVNGRESEAAGSGGANLIVGPYGQVRGHHVEQSAAHTARPGAKDPLYQKALAISQTRGDLSPSEHARISKVQTAMNRAAHSSVTGKAVRVGVGDLQVRSLTVKGSTSALDVRKASARVENVSFSESGPPAYVRGLQAPGRLPPTATGTFESLKSYFGLGQVNKVTPAQAFDLASRARAERGAPLRVPNAPSRISAPPGVGGPVIELDPAPGPGGLALTIGLLIGERLGLLPERDLIGQLAWRHQQREIAERFSEAYQHVQAGGAHFATFAPARHAP